jgi:hypothetical protein
MEISDARYDSLVEIFQAVADTIDGGSGWDDVADAYNEEMEKPHMKEFYGELVDNNPFNSLI